MYIKMGRVTDPVGKLHRARERSERNDKLKSDKIAASVGDRSQRGLKREISSLKDRLDGSTHEITLSCLEARIIVLETQLEDLHHIVGV